MDKKTQRTTRQQLKRSPKGMGKAHADNHAHLPVAAQLQTGRTTMVFCTAPHLLPHPVVIANGWPLAESTILLVAQRT